MSDLTFPVPAPETAAVVGPIQPVPGQHCGGVAFTVCTYNGEAENGKPEYDGADKNPVNVYLESGLRIVLGEKPGVRDTTLPNIVIERQPGGWVIFLSPDDGDALGYVRFPDNGAAHFESDGPNVQKVYRHCDE